MTTQTDEQPASDRWDDWHRRFGLTLTDVFSDTPWRVAAQGVGRVRRQP